MKTLRITIDGVEAVVRSYGHKSVATEMVQEVMRTMLARVSKLHAGKRAPVRATFDFAGLHGTVDFDDGITLPWQYEAEDHSDLEE